MCVCTVCGLAAAVGLVRTPWSWWGAVVSGIDEYALVFSIPSKSAVDWLFAGSDDDRPKRDRSLDRDGVLVDDDPVPVFFATISSRYGGLYHLGFFLSFDDISKCLFVSQSVFLLFFSNLWRIRSRCIIVDVRDKKKVFFIYKQAKFYSNCAVFDSYRSNLTVAVVYVPMMAVKCPNLALNFREKKISVGLIFWADWLRVYVCVKERCVTYDSDNWHSFISIAFQGIQFKY